MPKETKLHKTDNDIERVILVGVNSNDDKIDACLDELEELVNTAGAEVVGRLIQKREKIHTGHYIGKGKLEELQIMIDALDATGVVCDDELSPAQNKNMEKMISVKIMDRTMIILDIFARRAISREGKIQVELAQLKYRLSRLAGSGTALSRLGGGIGTRGPGEKKLETDRRYIKERISELNKELKEIETHRQLLRTQRNKIGNPVISMVGYTNAGKSTLINALTDAGVLAEDKLFATLDTTTRKVKLPGGSEIFFADTVGFIQKLPHQLIQAFRATLDELKYADILLHIVDVSNSNRDEQMEVVYDTLKNLGCENKPIITVFNKIDKDIELPLPNDIYARKTIKISAKNKVGLNCMLETIEYVLKSFRKSMKIIVPYAEGSIINYIYGRCEIILEEHSEKGILMNLYVDNESEGRLNKYKILEKN